MTPIDDGDAWVVRGTLDRYAAKRALQRYQLVDLALPPRDAIRVPPVWRVGLFRWNPCNEHNCWDGGGHVGHIDFRDRPGRGVWPGVYFQ